MAQYDSDEPSRLRVEVMTEFRENYGVYLTGHIISEDGHPHVERLHAQIATVYPKDYKEYRFFKVWPEDNKDPQLPENHNGKLWFNRGTTIVEVISDEDGNSLPKKVYLDDCRDTPDGWVRTFCPKETIEHLKSGWVSHLSLDHDLGLENCEECLEDPDTNHGYTVLTWLEEQVVLHGFVPPEHIAVHSDNSSARIKMEAAIRSIKKRTKKA